MKATESKTKANKKVIKPHSIIFINFYFFKVLEKNASFK